MNTLSLNSGTATTDVLEATFKSKGPFKKSSNDEYKQVTPPNAAKARAASI
jgi:hypothetical protein